MSDTVKQISVLQSNGSYISQPIGADAENVKIDATHTLADKASSWDSKANSSDLANYIPITSKGAINGVATLDAEGKIPSTQIPGGIQPQITIDPAPAEDSTNAVSSGGVYSALGGKVDKENGKGLSTNDYTTAEKTKLAEIESGAETNVIESISVNGVAQTITNKNVDLAISGGGTYVLPTATTTTLGGIKVGQNLTIDSDGTLNAQAGGSSYLAMSTADIDRLWKLATGNLMPSSWSPKTWNGGLTNFQGEYYLWSDGENIYYSNSSNQYILNKSTSTWETKTWNGLTNPYGEFTWTDGESVYYSRGDEQYILDKTTSTWITKTWNGLTYFHGRNVWTDGENIYYSNSEDQYILNKNTSTWEAKIWNGLASFSKEYIWTDGDNIYYSTGNEQYILDKSTSTWTEKTWEGLTDFSGGNIWTDGDNIYYSAGNKHYVLDKTANIWKIKTWEGLTDFSGGNIWTDGDNIYYSNYGNNQYVLDN